MEDPYEEFWKSISQELHVPRQVAKSRFLGAGYAQDPTEDLSDEGQRLLKTLVDSAKQRMSARRRKVESHVA